MQIFKHPNAIGRRLIALAMAALLSFAPAVNALAASTTTAQTLTVNFLDVGQGDAAIIQCGGQTMMIDGGKAKRSDYIYAWLKQHGITYIDYMIATHTDADHIGGLSGALNYATVGTAYCSSVAGDTKTFNNYVKYLAKQGKSITVPTAGTSLALGNALVQILGPISTHDGDNNSSIVVKVTYGSTSFLFTGDAESEEELELINSGADLGSTVLKVGHHGSATSTSYQFLRAVNPQYAVISVGADNTYGHPTSDVLSRLRDADIKTYRTDMQGEITMVSDGTNVAIATSRNADADTLAGAGPGQKSGSTSNSSGSSGNGSSSTPAAPAAANTYVLNTNTHKFHYPSCKSVKQMKDKNKRVVTESRDQIISQGYDPCKNCNP